MRQFFPKKCISFLLTLVLSFVLLSGCASAGTTGSGYSGNQRGSGDIFRTLDEIKESGVINIGVYSDKNPFCYVDQDGEYQGYDIYFAKRLGRDLGVNINFVSTDVFGRISNLETGKVDVVIANFTVTDERAQRVDFALPYMNVSLGLVSREDHVIKNLGQLEPGDGVVVIAGTMAESYFQKTNPGVKLISYESRIEAMSAFARGEGVAWASDNTDVIKFALENPGYYVGISSMGSRDTIAPAVTRGNITLLHWLNEEITALGKENFFHADYEATLIDVFGEAYEEMLVIEGESDSPITDDLSGIRPGHGTKIKVAASSVPHAEILKEAAGILGKYGYKLEIKEFDDYIKPNFVVESGDYDANYFQHVPYLESFNKEYGTHIVDAGDIHYEPFGIYPGKKISLTNVAKGDRIAIPGDASNEGRALLLLQDNGLITLENSKSLTSGIEDIRENPYDLQFIELPSEEVAEAADEAEYIILNGNYALEAGYSVQKDALASEQTDSFTAGIYVNIIGVYAGNENSDKIRALVAVLRSGAIKKFIAEKYDGSVVFFENK